MIERQIHYFKDRTKEFDDHYPCIRNECNVIHAYNWIHFFALVYTVVLQQQVEVRDYNCYPDHAVHILPLPVAQQPFQV